MASNPTKETPTPYKFEDDTEESAGGSSIPAVLNPTSIATIAIRARCQQAQSFLHYVKRVREEKKEDAATATATAGHGWDWVEDNCRCVFDLLGSVPAIGSLDLVYRRKLIWMLDIVSLRKSQVVFSQDDEQETVWLILGGRVDVSSKDSRGIVSHAKTFHAGEVLGNLLPERRLATATCMEQCTLLRVDGASFRRALEDPEAQRTVEKKSFFRSVSLFKGLRDRDLDRLAEVFQSVTLEAGDVLCREGDRVDFLYLVERGNLRLLKAFLPLPQDQPQHRPQEERQLITEQHGRRTTLSSTNPWSSISSGDATSAGDGRNPTIISQPPPQRLPPQRLQQQQQERRPQPSSPSPASSLPKVCHFEIGVAGRKEFIGEGGFTSAAFAAAGAGVAGSEAGSAQEERRGVAGGGGRRGGGGAGGDKNIAEQFHHGRVSRAGGNYLVSAVAEQRADVFAAKVSRLLPMQAPALKLCWIEGREVHRMKEREWNVRVLAEKLMEQASWEATKRAIVQDSVRMGLLKKRMNAPTRSGGGGAGAAHGRRGEGGGLAVTEETATASPPY